MDPERCDAGCFRRLVEHGWTFHSVTGHLYVRLSGVIMSDSAVVRFVFPELRRLLIRDLGEEGVNAHLKLRKAFLDISNTGLTDVGLRAFLLGWCDLGIGSCALCLMLQRNRLTDAAMVSLGDFAVAEGTGILEELHASHQRGPSPLSRAAVLAFLARLAHSSRYPIWVKRRRCFRPVHIRLNNCGVEAPELVEQELEGLTGARVCFAEDQGCVRNACKDAIAGGGGCPVAHLFDFRSQEPPTEDPELRTPQEAAARVEDVEGVDRQRGKSFLCGSCGRSLGIDMFTRSQFQKATHMDKEREAAAPAPGAAEKAHLVRRCNDCVTQPCCACKAELPLSAFAGTQMLRPPGSRRCRPCAADTWFCARCSRPKAQADFSTLEARKGKKTAKICRTCESSNPYFERRHVVCAVFGGRYAGLPARLPALAREVLLRILAFSGVARFVEISRTGFHCGLCARSWSFLASGDDAPIERHLRTSKVHARRLASLQAGNLVEIAAVAGSGKPGLELERFREGLGVRGAFCGRDQVQEARRLVDVWALRVAEPDLVLEALLAAGCRPGLADDCQGPRWATSEQVCAARERLRCGNREQRAMGGSIAAVVAAGRVLFDSSIAAELGAEDALEGQRHALLHESRKVGMLCDLPEGAEDGEVDEDEMAELRRFLRGR